MVNIKVLGAGCANCQNLERLCREVANENNIQATIEKITDIKKFVAYGLLMTPGLVINEKLVSSGKIPAKSNILQWINAALE
jgi:small redox-active disulfide protein 2